MTIPQTINIGPANKYTVQKTIGGYVVVWLRIDREISTVDGGKVYPQRKQAYARARRLNTLLSQRIAKYGCVEAYFDGYIATVCENDLEGGYDLSVQIFGMPAHYHKHCDTVEEVAHEMNTKCFFPLPVDWKAVKPEAL